MTEPTDTDPVELEPELTDAIPGDELVDEGEPDNG